QGLYQHSIAAARALDHGRLARLRGHHERERRSPGSGRRLPREAQAEFHRPLGWSQELVTPAEARVQAKSWLMPAPDRNIRGQALRGNDERAMNLWRSKPGSMRERLAR